jgi:SAM-dependent methyltransferase
MKECSKSIARRLADSNFTRRYFVGEGIDIGGRPDPLSLYAEFFVLMKYVLTWDWEDGDAQFMTGVSDNSVDFVHSSHCLEHLIDPYEGFQNWFRILRPGGHLIITVPDEDLYEQGLFPSTFNRDHKWTFTTWKSKSWSDYSVNVVDLVTSLGEQADLIKMEQLISSYRFSFPRYDQTLTPVGESGIEIVIRKRLPNEIATGGRVRHIASTPREIRLHLNQYRDDHKMMKSCNLTAPPFSNDQEI